jgi:redox-sensitive bicupin YhaK (pirin superfamily)
MITLRRSAERGHIDHGWLDTYHSFSFGDYHDQDHMGFRDLRVINDDRVAAGQGFGTHGHRDMEILTYMLEGALQHKDSMGNGSVIRPGDVQRMTAGTGVMHSEFNPSRDEAAHLLQIWVLPERRNLQPGYEQKAFSVADRRGQLRLLASRDGRDGSVSWHQDVDLYGTLLAPGERVSRELRLGRHAWVHVARGEVVLNGTALATGDAAAFSGEPALDMTATTDAEVLVFDLA